MREIRLNSISFTFNFQLKKIKSITLIVARGIRAVIASILVGLFCMIRESKQIKKDEKTRFECGFMNMRARKINFSTNFIMVVIIFLIFDIEVSIIITIRIVRKINISQHLVSTVFLLVVRLLLVKEWWQGTLD